MLVGKLPCFVCILLVFSGMAAGENLLLNPGFEEELDPDGWTSRFRDTESRTAYITSEPSYSGDRSFVIELQDSKASFTSARQGEPGVEFRIEEGDMVELSGWVKTDFTTQETGAGIRVYFFDKEGNPVSERRAPQLSGESDWTFQTVNVEAPSKAASCSAYVSVYGGGTGRAYFDAMRLAVHKQEVPNDRFLVVTDAEVDDPVIGSLKTLYPGRIVVDDSAESLDVDEFKGVVLFSREGKLSVDMDATEAFVSRGGNAVFDLSLYGELRGLSVKRQSMSEDKAVMNIVREHPITNGFAVGDRLPWFDEDDGNVIQRQLEGAIEGTVLAEGSNGGAVLVAERHDEGHILATDLTGLPEPRHRRPGAYNKYLFLGNLLGETVRYGRHYNERYSYEEFVRNMQELAARHDGVRFKDEGPASGGFRIYSLGMGDTEKPTFFLYAAAHGSEWEPAYGLLTLVELLADRPQEELFDFDRYSLKVVPIFNPYGYQNFSRTNANGVDLNRNTGAGWEETPTGEGTGKYKGEAPFSEPESRTFRDMLDRLAPHAYLDFHGNLGGSGNNRLLILPYMEDRHRHFGHETHAWNVMESFNEAFTDRYVVEQARRSEVRQYEKESLWNDAVGGGGRMQNYAASRGAVGFLSESPAQNRGAYHTVFNTDLVIELCLAFFRAFESHEQAEAGRLDVPYVEVDTERLRPLVPPEGEGKLDDDYTLTEGRVWTRVDPAKFMLYAEAGDDVTIRVQHRDPTTREEGKKTPFTVIGPVGKQIYQEDVPFRKKTDIKFNAPEAGIYRLTANPGTRGVVTVEGASHPVNMDLDNRRVMLRWCRGDYYFWVPKGTSEFAVRVTGRRTAGVRAMLFDSDGELYQDSGDTRIHQFHVKLPDESDGEAWRLQLIPPDKVGHGSMFVELAGIPSLLAPSDEALLVYE